MPYTLIDSHISQQPCFSCTVAEHLLEPIIDICSGTLQDHVESFVRNRLMVTVRLSKPVNDLLVTSGMVVVSLMCEGRRG